MIQTRSECRISQELPVRIYGTDGAGKPVNETAWTLDVSPRGARLKGLPHWSGLGEIVTIRHGDEKARFRVMWIGEHGTAREGQVGVLCMDNGRSIWGMLPVNDEPAMTEDSTAAAGAKAVAAATSTAKRRNRRSETRHTLGGEAQVRERGVAAAHRTGLRDISLNGCYLEMTTPLRPGTKVDVTVSAGDEQIIAKGEVTVAHRGTGMGVRFTQVTPMNRHRLERLVERLSGSAAASA